jgi:hypothetical protein
MQVEGVWLAISERADFEAYLQQHNNSVPDLTRHLRQMASRIEQSGRMVHDGGDND